MVELLTNSDKLFYAVVAWAILSPILGIVLFRKVAFEWRVTMVFLGALGPWMLALWALQVYLIRIFGFDSIVTAGALVGVGLLTGAVAGWIARPRPDLDVEASKKPSGSAEAEEPGV